MKKVVNFKEVFVLVLILIIALVGLYGWSTGKLLLTRFSVLSIPMAPSTALSFVLLTLSLFFVFKFGDWKYARLFSVVLISTVIVFGSTILSQFLFDFNWDLENIFLEKPAAFANVPSGRMSPLTAGLFILYGIAILILTDIPKNSRSKEKTYGVIVIFALFISTILLIGYLYETPLLYGLNVIPVALPTAICFWLLGFALFSFMGFNFLFFTDSISSIVKKLSKTLILLTLFIVIIHPFIDVTFHQNLENQAILSALLLIIIIPLTIFTIYFSSKFLGQSIYKAEQAVIESENKLKDLFKHMNEGFALHEIITDGRGTPVDYKYLEINPAFTQITGLVREKVIGKKVRDIFPGIENDSANWIEKYGDVALNGKEITYEGYSQAVDRWYIAHAFCPKKGQFAVTFSDITDRKKAEIELKESEREYKDLFENIKEGFALCKLITDDAGKPIDYSYLKVNPEFGKILGVKHDKLIGKTLSEVFPGSENASAKWITKFSEVTITGKQILFEDYSESIKAWFLVQAFRPQPGQIAFTFMDISDRKKNENRFKNMFSNAFVGSIINRLIKDEHGNAIDFIHLDANAAVKRHLGADPAQIVGRLASQLVSPEQTKFMTKLNEKVVNKGVAYNIEKRFEEFDKTLELSAFHLEDDLFVSTFIDISDRKGTEEALIKSKERYRGMLQNIETGIIVYAPDTTIIMNNERASELLGESISQMTGTVVINSSSKFVNQDNSPLSFNEFPVNRVLSSRESFLNQILGIYLPNAKSILWLNVNGLPMFDSAGAITEIVISFIDITDRRLAEEEIKQLNKNLEHKVFHRTNELENKSKDLKESQNALLNIVEDLNEQSYLLEESTKKLENTNKELKAFTYSVSHDLKAPLRGIDGYSKLLLELHSKDLNPEAQTFLNNIRSGTAQMNQLIEDLLAYSRLERSTMRDTEIDVNKIINDIVANYKEEIETRKIQMIIDVKKTIILTDYNGLAMALRNLIENAIKFTLLVPSPIINIRFIQSESDWEISVKDNGIGFKMDYHDRIFEIFQRLHHVEDYPGTGIGLALVKKAMERMGGSITADSEPNLGATFVIKIPKK